MDDTENTEIKEYENLAQDFFEFVKDKAPSKGRAVILTLAEQDHLFDANPDIVRGSNTVNLLHRLEPITTHSPRHSDQIRFTAGEEQIINKLYADEHRMDRRTVLRMLKGATIIGGTWTAERAFASRKKEVFHQEQADRQLNAAHSLMKKSDYVDAPIEKKLMREAATQQARQAQEHQDFAVAAEHETKSHMLGTSVLAGIGITLHAAGNLPPLPPITEDGKLHQLCDQAEVTNQELDIITVRARQLADEYTTALNAQIDAYIADKKAASANMGR